MASASDSPSASMDPSSKGKYYRYYVLFLLSLIYLLSSIDRIVISTLGEPLKHEFNLSDTQLGVLTGLFFAISFSICGVPIGMLIDRVNRVRLLAGLLALWSMLTAVSSFATSYTMLAIARIGVGGAESGAPAASTSLIADYFPPERRGTAISFLYVSTPIGVSAAFVFGGFVAAHYGWRAAFLMAGLPGLLLSLLLVLTIREPVRGGAERSEGTAAVKAPSLTSILPALRAQPVLLGLIFAGMCLVAAQAGTNSFVTPFLMRVHHISIQQAGYALGAAQFVPGILGVLVGGVLADKAAQRSTHVVLFMLAFLMLLTGPSGAAAYLADDWRLAIVILGGHYFLLALYYGAHFSTYITLAPVQYRGTFAALLAVCMTLAGYGLGPVVVGVSSDFAASLGLAEPLRWAQVATTSLFLVAGGFYLLSGILVRRSAKHGETNEL